MQVYSLPGEKSNISVPTLRIGGGLMMPSLRLLVHFIKEKDTIIAYSPALDLSAYGDTIESAKKNFIDTVKVFFEQTKENGTTEEVLNGLGWEKITTFFGRPHWNPPQEIKAESIPISVSI